MKWFDFAFLFASLLVCLPHLCDSPRAQSRERLWRASRLPRIVIAISPRKRQTLLSTAKSASVLNLGRFERSEQLKGVLALHASPFIAEEEPRPVKHDLPRWGCPPSQPSQRSRVGAKSQLAKGRNSASPYIAMQSPCLQIRQRHCYAIQVHILGPRAKLVQCTLLLARRNCYQGPNMDQQHRHS